MLQSFRFSSEIVERNLANKKKAASMSYGFFPAFHYYILNCGLMGYGVHLFWQVCCSLHYALI